MAAPSDPWRRPCWQRSIQHGPPGQAAGSRARVRRQAIAHCARVSANDRCRQGGRSWTRPTTTHLERNAANYVPLSPLSLPAPHRRGLSRPHRPMSTARSAAPTGTTYARCRRLASALQARGIGKGDTVAIMAANIPAFLEAHFGVPAMRRGAQLAQHPARRSGHRLHPGPCRGQGAADRHARFPPSSRTALALAKAETPGDRHRRSRERGGRRAAGEIEYEEFLAEGDPEARWELPADEWDAISLNYTSGTTGNPKGVVYHHRGAYLNAHRQRARLGHAAASGLPVDPAHVPLQRLVLPLDHRRWSPAPTSACARSRPGRSSTPSPTHGVTHLCGAPIVLNMLINAKADERRSFDHPVKVMTAAAPPPAAVLARMEAMGFDVTHVYGLTETYGPAVVCAWHGAWDELTLDEQADLKARQGVRLSGARGAHRRPTRRPASRCPPTARPSARSCSAATSS